VREPCHAPSFYRKKSAKLKTLPAKCEENCRSVLLISRLGLSSPRLSGSLPFRSAVPLAAAGIACLGLTPTFGGPDRPLHWAMTAGMVGFGALLWGRHRLRGREGELEAIPAQSAVLASRALLAITAFCAVICCAIIGSRVYAGKSLAALSVLMPAVGLAWLGWLGWKMRQLRPAPVEAASASDRPSRRPPKRDSLTPPLSSQGDAASNRHASA
jgi:hypothetical protein